MAAPVMLADTPLMHPTCKLRCFLSPFLHASSAPHHRRLPAILLMLLPGCCTAATWLMLPQRLLLLAAEAAPTAHELLQVTLKVGEGLSHTLGAPKRLTLVITHQQLTVDQTTLFDDNDVTLDRSSMWCHMALSYCSV